MKMRNTYLIVLVAILFAQCTETNMITMQYDLTYCADKWEFDKSNLSVEEKETIIETYLKEEENVLLESIKIKEQVTSPEVCNACSCKSGDVIEVTIEDGFELQLGDLGFYK